MKQLVLSDVAPVYRRCPYCGRALASGDEAGARHVDPCRSAHKRYLAERLRLETGER